MISRDFSSSYVENYRQCLIRKCLMFPAESSRARRVGKLNLRKVILMHITNLYNRICNINFLFFMECVRSWLLRDSMERVHFLRSPITRSKHLVRFFFTERREIFPSFGRRVNLLGEQTARLSGALGEFALSRTRAIRNRDIRVKRGSRMTH